MPSPIEQSFRIAVGNGPYRPVAAPVRATLRVKVTCPVSRLTGDHGYSKLKAAARNAGPEEARGPTEADDGGRAPQSINNNSSPILKIAAREPDAGRGGERRAKRRTAARRR